MRLVPIGGAGALDNVKDNVPRKNSLASYYWGSGLVLWEPREQVACAKVSRVATRPPEHERFIQERSNECLGVSCEKTAR